MSKQVKRIRLLQKSNIVVSVIAWCLQLIYQAVNQLNNQL